jgi:sodium/hydrogen antiporter
VFEFDSYHVLLAALGSGLILFSLVPGMPSAPDPLTSPSLWELLSGLAVIVALFGTSLRIDNAEGLARWAPTVRLLAIAMPLTMIGVASLGWAFTGMTVVTGSKRNAA